MTYWRCTACDHLRPIEHPYCPHCGADHTRAEIYESPPVPTVAKEAPKPRAPIILIALIIAAIVAVITDQPPIQAIITGIISFIIWYLILHVISRALRR